MRNFKKKLLVGSLIITMALGGVCQGTPVGAYVNYSSDTSFNSAGGKNLTIHYGTKTKLGKYTISTGKNKDNKLCIYSKKVGEKKECLGRVVNGNHYFTYKKRVFFLGKQHATYKYVPGKKVERVKAIKKITYIAGIYGKKNLIIRSKNVLKAYNVATGKMKVLTDKFPKNVYNFGIYGNYAYCEKYVKHQEKLYAYNMKKDKMMLTRLPVGMFIKNIKMNNNILYFTGNQTTVKNENGEIATYTSDDYRIFKWDLKNEPEEMISNAQIINFHGDNMYYFNYKADEENKIQAKTIHEYNMKTKAVKVIKTPEEVDVEYASKIIKKGNVLKIYIAGEHYDESRIYSIKDDGTGFKLVRTEEKK